MQKDEIIFPVEKYEFSQAVTTSSVSDDLFDKLQISHDTLTDLIIIKGSANDVKEFLNVLKIKNNL